MNMICRRIVFTKICCFFRFDLFYGIRTLVVYSMPNHIYIYIYIYIYVCVCVCVCECRRPKLLVSVRELTRLPEYVWKHFILWGLCGLRSRAKGKAVLPLDIWLHILVILFYLTPTLVSRCNALPKKVPKRIIQKKRQTQIRDEDVSFILSFIYWVQQPFHGWGSFSWIHWNGVKNMLNRFMYVCVRIWYFELS